MLNCSWDNWTCCSLTCSEVRSKISSESSEVKTSWMKFLNMKLKLPRLIRLKFLSKFFTNWKFGFLQSFFNLKFQQLWLFFESIQNKLSRLDLTFFQLFYDGLFKQSFPSRNPKIPKIPKFWVVKFWISKLRYES